MFLIIDESYTKNSFSANFLDSYFSEAKRTEAVRTELPYVPSIIPTNPFIWTPKLCFPLSYRMNHPSSYPRANSPTCILDAIASHLFKGIALEFFPLLTLSSCFLL